MATLDLSFWANYYIRGWIIAASVTVRHWCSAVIEAVRETYEDVRRRVWPHHCPQSN